MSNEVWTYDMYKTIVKCTELNTNRLQFEPRDACHLSERIFQSTGETHHLVQDFKFQVSGRNCSNMTSINQHANSHAVKASAWKDCRHVDLMMPQVRDVSQYSSAAFGNTVFHVGTPPKKENPDRLVASSMFPFSFGKAPMPDIVQAGDPILHEVTEEVPLEVSFPRKNSVKNILDVTDRP